MGTVTNTFDVNEFIFNVCKNDEEQTINALINEMQLFVDSGVGVFEIENEKAILKQSKNVKDITVIQELISNYIEQKKINFKSNELISNSKFLIFELGAYGFLVTESSIKLNSKSLEHFKKSLNHIGRYLCLLDERKNQNEPVIKEKATQNNSRFREKMFRYMIRHMNMGLIEFNTENVIEYANLSFGQISGFRLDELIGNNLNDFPFSKWEGKVIQSQENMDNSMLSNNYEISFIDKNGNQKHWLISGAQNYNEQKQLIGTIGIVLDISNQKQLEKEIIKEKEKAESASVAKEMFLANMSHEIRNPLNIISGLIRNLRDEKDENLKIEYLQYAQNASDYLLSLLSNVLDISEIEKGEFYLENSPFNLNEIVNDVLNYFKLECKSKGISIELKLTTDFSSLYSGDGARIKQILFNLVGNAVKFSNDGTINFQLSEVESKDGLVQIMFEISDTGVGFNQQQKEKYFEYSFDKFNGLGLRISHSLIEQMKGTINLKSEEGIGTKVIFSIPLNPVHHHNFTENIKKTSSQSLANLHVLIVDDIEMNNRILQKLLSKYGAKTTLASNGLEAIQRLKIQEFDLILMDIQMPKMDGIEAVKFIRNNLSSQVPIIAITANAFVSDIKHYKAVGMNDTIVKPFKEDEVISKILKQLSNMNIESISSFESIENYDLSVLEKLSDGDKDFVKEMIQLFIELTPQSLKEIENAFLSSDFQSISKTAHRMKQSVANIGLNELKNKIINLEKFSKQNEPNVSVLKGLFDEISVKLNSTLEELKLAYKK